MSKRTHASFKVDNGTAIVQNMVIGGTEAEVAKVFAAEEAAALRKGHTVIHADGRRVWRDRMPEMTGGEFTWHADGNRVRAKLMEYTLYPDGRKESRVIRRSWVHYDNLE